MHYGTIKPLDIANGPGCRVSLFVSGCRNRCEGCFQPETWSFTYGEEFGDKALERLHEMLANPHVRGLSILGGDPFEPENREIVEWICMSIKMRELKKDIWVWTGYLWEDLKDLPVMDYIDVLVDGPFVKELKDLNLFYRGSSNQRVIDIPKSREMNCAIRWQGDQKWR